VRTIQLPPALLLEQPSENSALKNLHCFPALALNHPASTRDQELLQLHRSAYAVPSASDLFNAFFRQKLRVPA
jgi:hypothetical protein